MKATEFIQAFYPRVSNNNELASTFLIQFNNI